MRAKFKIANKKQPSAFAKRRKKFHKQLYKNGLLCKIVRKKIVPNGNLLNFHNIFHFVFISNHNIQKNKEPIVIKFQLIK